MQARHSSSGAVNDASGMIRTIIPHSLVKAVLASHNGLCLKKSRLNLVLSNNGGRKLAGRSELHDVISGFPSAGFSCF